MSPTTADVALRSASAVGVTFAGVPTRPSALTVYTPQPQPQSRAVRRRASMSPDMLSASSGGLLSRFALRLDSPAEATSDDTGTDGENDAESAAATPPAHAGKASPDFKSKGKGKTRSRRRSRTGKASAAKLKRKHSSGSKRAMAAASPLAAAAGSQTPPLVDRTSPQPPALWSPVVAREPLSVPRRAAPLSPQLSVTSSHAVNLPILHTVVRAFLHRHLKEHVKVVRRSRARALSAVQLVQRAEAERTAAAAEHARFGPAAARIAALVAAVTASAAHRNPTAAALKSVGWLPPPLLIFSAPGTLEDLTAAVDDACHVPSFRRWEPKMLAPLPSRATEK